MLEIQMKISLQTFMTDVVGFCFATLPDTPKFCMSKKTYWSLPQFREEVLNPITYGGSD